MKLFCINLLVASIGLAACSTVLVAETIDVRTLLVGEGHRAPERYLKKQGSYQLLTFLQRQPSSLVRAEIAEGLPLYEKVDVAGKPSEYRIIDIVKLPEAAKAVLILALSVDDEYSYVALDDEYFNASYDRWLLINTTPKALFFKVGSLKEAIQVEPYGKKIQEFELPDSGGVPVLGRAVFDGKEKTFYSTYWPVRPSERPFVVFTEKGNRIRVSKISDILKR